MLLHVLPMLSVADYPIGYPIGEPPHHARISRSAYMNTEGEYFTAPFQLDANS